MSGWQVKLCDRSPCYHGPYLSTLAMGNTVIEHYTNVQLLYFTLLTSQYAETFKKLKSG